MNTTISLALATACVCIAASAFAQGASGPGPKPGMPGASAPASGPGMGMGMGMGMGRHGMAGPDYTSGWSMMTPAERSEHQARMHSATTREACQAEMEAHRKLMAERAKAQGGKAMGQPRHDPCGGMKP